MIKVNWNSNVNTNFYAYNTKPKNNITITENLSGRAVGYQANTKNIMVIKCSLRLSIQELNIFWSWFNDTLNQMAGSFYCSALDNALGKTNQLYRFTSIPEPEDTDLNYRDLSLEIEEVY